MHLRSQIDAHIKIISSDTTCTAEDRALLSEFSAKLYETDAVKKFRVE
jgi:hypothetical protein